MCGLEGSCARPLHPRRQAGAQLNEFKLYGLLFAGSRGTG